MKKKLIIIISSVVGVAIIAVLFFTLILPLILGNGFANYPEREYYHYARVASVPQDAKVESVDSYGFAVLTKNIDNQEQYAVYDLINGTYVYDFKEYRIYNVESGLYCMIVSDSIGSTTRYTYIGKNGTITTVDATSDAHSVNNTDLYYFETESGRVYYDIESGKVTSSLNDLKSYVESATYVTDDYYISSSNSSQFAVYNKETYELERIINVDKLFGSSSSSSGSVNLLADGNLVYQYIEEMPGNSDDYDYFVKSNGYNEGTKYKLHTCILNLKNGDFTEKDISYCILDCNNKFTNADVTDYYTADNIMHVNFIENKTITREGYILANNGLGIVFDGSKITDSILTKIANNKYYAASDNIIYDESGKILANNVSVTQSGNFIKAGDSYYDFDFNAVYTLDENETFIGAYGDYILTRKYIDNSTATAYYLNGTKIDSYSGCNMNAGLIYTYDISENKTKIFSVDMFNSSAGDALLTFDGELDFLQVLKNDEILVVFENSASILSTEEFKA